ncbi:MAG: 16S rRNA (adenine(1518)-N(6)/adenine(1519)-N(6))-dimethyltransferase RsmA [bacterium]
MKTTREILKDYGYKAKKGRGQNFLVNEGVLQRIVDSAGLEANDTVVEIGPGPGNLTRRLVKRAGTVIAIESDHELSSILQAELDSDNLTVRHADVLEVDLSGLFQRYGRMKVIANLPYNITTPVLFKLLDNYSLFSELLLLVQLEVANRITAFPGTKAYGVLAARTALLADTELLFKVPPESFRPRPRVTSALIRIKILENPRADIAPELYRRTVRAAFSRKRKTILNSLAESGEFSRAVAEDALAAAGIEPGRRAETLSVEEFARLGKALFDKEG